MIGEHEQEIREILDRLASGRAAKTETWQRTAYPGKVLSRSGANRKGREALPSLAAGKDGLYLAFTRFDRKGGAAVLIRRLDASGKKVWEHIASEGYDDAYHGVVAADREGRARVFFTALADSGKYDVFTRTFDVSGEAGDAKNLTRSSDDAMHPAVTTDADGRIWVAYYRWHKMGFHSRDKEVYARRLDGDTFGDEIRCSPEDVPTYEDHTDPAIAPAPGGGVVTAWSWDMHPLKDEKYAKLQHMYRAESPTIFGRALTAAGGAGKLVVLGSRGIDGLPSLFLDSTNRLWCAWNTLDFRAPEKTLYASWWTGEGEGREDQLPVEEGVLDVRRAAFAEAGGKVHLVWASRRGEGEPWRLMRSAWGGKTWSPPEVIDAKGMPGTPALAVGPDGTLWLARPLDKGKARTIVLDTL